MMPRVKWSMPSRQAADTYGEDPVVLAICHKFNIPPLIHVWNCDRCDAAIHLAQTKPPRRCYRCHHRRFTLTGYLSHPPGGSGNARPHGPPATLPEPVGATPRLAPPS